MQITIMQRAFSEACSVLPAMWHLVIFMMILIERRLLLTT
jgi:hypothetical protein